MADIFDAVAIGEAEAIVPPLIDTLWESVNLPRAQALEQLAQVDGLYVPALNNGPVHRVWLRDLNNFPTINPNIHPQYRIWRPDAD